MRATPSPSNRLVPPSSSGKQPSVAPEYVTRLLHLIDTDNDEFITKNDLVNFVKKHDLRFDPELLESMFAEANTSADGLMDAEQLGKAVSHKFPYRKHNENWLLLFERAPWPEGTSRITALSPRAVEQEPIRANFEQEPEILTFWPLTNDHGAGASPGPLGSGPGCITCSTLRCVFVWRERRDARGLAEDQHLGSDHRVCVCVCARAHTHTLARSQCRLLLDSTHATHPLVICRVQHRALAPREERGQGPRGQRPARGEQDQQVWRP